MSDAFPAWRPGEGLGFRLLAQDGAARRGRFATAHGEVQTPGFMAVGTQGTVKGLTPEQVRATGAEIVLGNTYHLMLRPGERTVASLGGLHGFAAWPGPMLTDSGGYQAYSMSDLVRLDDQAVTFRSVVDGSMVALSPERAVEAFTRRVQYRRNQAALMETPRLIADALGAEADIEAIAQDLAQARRLFPLRRSAVP